MRSWSVENWILTIPCTADRLRVIALPVKRASWHPGQPCIGSFNVGSSTFSVRRSRRWCHAPLSILNPPPLILVPSRFAVSPSPRFSVSYFTDSARSTSPSAAGLRRLCHESGVDPRFPLTLSSSMTSAKKWNESANTALMGTSASASHGDNGHGSPQSQVADSSPSLPDAATFAARVPPVQS